MNITREKLGDLDLCIRVDIAESDYSEEVTKQLKEYRRKASVPGFRKGMAPMGLVQRMYKSAIVADTVQGKLNESLFKYLEDEKLDIVGYPLSNEEKTGSPDFEKAVDFTFYFDAALSPEVNIDWSKIDAKLYAVKSSESDIDELVSQCAERFGKFETPEVVGEGDYVYGKVVELVEGGEAKEGGMNTFCSFSLKEVADAGETALFVGKKNEEKVVFNPAKAFTAEQIEKFFHLDAEAAKALTADCEFTVSGVSRITPAEIGQELFDQAFPGEGVDSVEKLREALRRESDKANAEQCKLLFVSQVRKQILDSFDAPIPETFIKRWIVSRSKDETAEQVDEKWNDVYLPSLKMEFIDGALNKIRDIEPTENEVVDAVKDILRRGDRRPEGETDEQMETRLEQAARSISENRDNVRQLRDKIYTEKSFALFEEQLKPSVEEVTAAEFAELFK